MLSKSYTVDTENLLIYKTKDRKKIVSFDPTYKNENAKIIYYQYIDEKPLDKKGVTKETQIIQGVFNEDYFNLKGAAHKEIRETRNKFNKKLNVSIYQNTDLNDIIELIKKWELDRGWDNYGFIMHSGYDKAFFNKYVDNPNLLTLVFRDKENNSVVGYSVIEKEPKKNEKGISEYTFLLRKCDTKYSRNVNEYIDYKTYEFLWDKSHTPFTVNLGCSGNKLKWYKTHKFPIYELTEKYFWRETNDAEI